ncbi:MAG: SMC family ATPase [Acidobacteriota bacterium]
MRITKVEIENIKNAEHAVYTFEPGITAISGPNGAGKTTIIEAIAYAIFDHLPFRKEEFIKRGAKKGSVRVNFISSIDGREYTVYRDTGSLYYVLDPITGGRLVEQKAQVSRWIQEHLGVETTADLKTLFISTIGVPQGTFTNDFAEQPAKRKQSFDKVLRVEEYQKAADEMRLLVKSLETQEVEFREKVLLMEAEIADLNSLQAEHQRLNKLLQTLNDEISEIEDKKSALRSALDQLESINKAIDEVKNEIQQTQIRIEGLQHHQLSVSQGVELSRTAAEVVKAAQKGYEVYQQAQIDLKALEPQIAIRDNLQQEIHENQKERIRLEVFIQAQKAKLEQVTLFKSELANLKDKLVAQHQLEEKIITLENQLTEIKVFNTTLEKEEKSLKHLRVDFQRLVKSIEEGEGFRDLAEQLPEFEKQKQLLDAELKSAQILHERYLLNLRELDKSTAKITDLRKEIKRTENTLADIKKFEVLANRLPEFEMRGAELTEQITILKTNITREDKMVAEIKNGLCPLLSQKCLNMEPGVGLDKFFKIQIHQDRESLSKLQKQNESIHQEIQTARQALNELTRLSAQQTHYERIGQELNQVIENHRKLNEEIDAGRHLAEQIKDLNDQQESLNQQLMIARQAFAKFSSVAVLKEQLERITLEGQKRKEYVENLKAKIASGDSVVDELNQSRDELSILGDPKGRSKVLQIEIDRESEYRSALAEHEKSIAKIQRLLADKESRLAQYKNLDLQVAKTRDLISENLADFHAYIENLSTAQLLESRIEEEDKVKRELESLRNHSALKSVMMSQLMAQYDGQKHARFKQQLEQYLQLQATKSSEQKNSQLKYDEVEKEIKRLLIIKGQLDEIKQSQTKIEWLKNLVELIREVLKKSGPFITEAHLKTISIEANQLFREITGNPMVSLRWDTGYEVVYEEAGFERSFGSLSGGEQMAAALSVRLALLKELSDIRFAFFDEPTTNMDEERRRNLAEQIGRIKDLNQLLVISHDDTFEGFTDNVLELRREDR